MNLRDRVVPYKPGQSAMSSKPPRARALEDDTLTLNETADLELRVSLSCRTLQWVLAAVFLALTLLVGRGIAERRPFRIDPREHTPAARHVAELVLRRDGLAAALDTLERLAVTDTTVQRDGHQMAHALGREAVALHAGDAAVVRDCRPVFASGCYHGVVEAALHAAGHIEVRGLERLCAAAEGPTGPGAAFECIHGLGHGILGARGYDLEATLQDCDLLSTRRRAASCYSGAFMEAINSALGVPAMPGSHDHVAGHEHVSVRRLAIDPADPYSPCGAVADPYATSCWLFQGFVILRANGFDAARALRVCDLAPGDRGARCYEGVGHQLTGLFQRGDRWSLDQCARGAASLAAHCAAGAALALDAMDWSGARAARLCALAPVGWKETCYRSAAQALTDLATPAERTRLCASVEPAYAAVCREAADLAGKKPREGASTRTAGS